MPSSVFAHAQRGGAAVRFNVWVSDWASGGVAFIARTPRFRPTVGGACVGGAAGGASRRGRRAGGRRARARRTRGGRGRSPTIPRDSAGEGTSRRTRPRPQCRGGRGRGS